MTWIRSAHGAGLAGVLLLAVAAGPLLLAGEGSSTLAPGIGEGEVLHRQPSAPAPPRFAVEGREVTFAFDRAFPLAPDRDALLLVSPAVGFTEGEVRRIDAFLRAGGRVLVADDAGAGQELLDDLGAGIALSSHRLYTPGFEREVHRLVATSTGALRALPSEVALSAPVTVQGGTPVLTAPDLAWQDLDDDRAPDLNEPLSGGAVAAVAPVGAGILLVVGDPDALASSSPETKAALVAWLAEGDRRLVVDEAHRIFADPFGANPLLAGTLGSVTATGILFAAGLLVAVLVLGPRFRGERSARRAPLRARGTDPAILAEVLRELDPR